MYPQKSKLSAFYELSFGGRTLGSLEEKGTVSCHNPGFVRGGQLRALESSHVKGQHRETGRDSMTQREERLERFEEEKNRERRPEAKREKKEVGAEGDPAVRAGGRAEPARASRPVTPRPSVRPDPVLHLSAGRALHHPWPLGSRAPVYLLSSRGQGWAPLRMPRLRTLPERPGGGQHLVGDS